MRGQWLKYLLFFDSCILYITFHWQLAKLCFHSNIYLHRPGGKRNLLFFCLNNIFEESHIALSDTFSILSNIHYMKNRPSIFFVPRSHVLVKKKMLRDKIFNRHDEKNLFWDYFSDWALNFLCHVTTFPLFNSSCIFSLYFSLCVIILHLSIHSSLQIFLAHIYSSSFFILLFLRFFISLFSFHSLNSVFIFSPFHQPFTLLFSSLVLFIYIIGYRQCTLYLCKTEISHSFMYPYFVSFPDFLSSCKIFFDRYIHITLTNLSLLQGENAKPKVRINVLALQERCPAKWMPTVMVITTNYHSTAWKK